MLYYSAHAFQGKLLMGALDDHNHQHTFGNSLGPPTSAAAVSAQQSIDAHKRLVESSVASPSTATSAPGSRAHLTFALVSAAIALAFAVAAYVIGGIGAVALGLVAAAAGVFAAVFLVTALIQGMKSAFSSRK